MTLKRKAALVFLATSLLNIMFAIGWHMRGQTPRPAATYTATR